MKGTLKNSYKKAGPKGPQTIFVYRVSGPKDEVEKYVELKDAEGYLTEDDDGTPLYFTNRYYGDTITIMITENENIVIDTTTFDKLASLVESNPFLADAISGQFANQILSGIKGVSASGAVRGAVSQETETETESTEDQNVEKEEELDL